MHESATILVVDDTRANRYTERRILEQAGYRVLEAATGIDALRMAEEHRPELVVLDVKLPDISGFEVAQRLRANPETQWTQILHISATYRAPEQHARGLESGADGYLTSPIEPIVLTATVRALLRARRAEEHATLLAKAEEALRARDDFIAMVSHDLRDPVGLLVLRLELIQKRLQAGQTLSVGALLADIEMMRLQLARLAKMLDLLLETNRMTAGQVPLVVEELDIAALAVEIVENCRERFEEAGCMLIVHAQRPLRGRWDRRAVDRIITNLLSNAACYGAGHPVELRVVQEGPHVRISVRDQGIGIAPEDQARIFARFERATCERRSGSFGIGLWTVKRLVDALSGRVWVEGEVGVGSVFTVELPGVAGS